MPPRDIGKVRGEELFKSGTTTSISVSASESKMVVSVPISAHPGTGKLIKADGIAAKFRADIEQATATVAARTRRPCLLGILATSSAPSRAYAQSTKTTCESIGIKFILKQVGGALDDGIDGEGVEEAIVEGNEDPNVDGIMDHYIQQVVSPVKDVEGLRDELYHNLYHNVRFIRLQVLLSATTTEHPIELVPAAEAPEGYVKPIIPCTPLAIVKILEAVGVYNSILDYGDRAYGRTITIINRSEVVGRPLAAMLANDGARVLSVDIGNIQEYTKRPVSKTSDVENSKRYNPRHVVHPCSLSLEQCLAISDVVVSAVPNASYKVPTKWLKDGCVCINVASEKNFQSNVREKVGNTSLYAQDVG
ncbi:Methylenetetrahydrofolate dehydrogenase (NAD+) [Ceratobasidium theobromae]|uniref:Methylenetetrahydrofolate dehydrogenase (NAD+) n=1 Tax=Ceratobasidium theobromae TaxID=1582974 RepID=A0A5N5QSW5_9AGAM|nr:Methylenetetrahydrofolate dehydrogenase (NAD+) [Ceratobasidium theobromae]